MASTGNRRLDQLIQTLVNPNASYQDKSSALKQLELVVQSGPEQRATVAMGLRDNGLGINAKGKITTQGGKSPLPQAGDFTQGQWGTVNAQMGASPLRSPVRSGGGNSVGQSAEDTMGPGLSLTEQRTRYPGVAGAENYPDAGAGTGAGGDPGFESGTPYNSADARVDSKYGNTFFGGVPEANLNEVAGSPDMAWSLFRTRGGPGGGDLQNSTIGRYGDDNFKSSMFFQDILGGAGQSNPDFLGSTDAAMRRQMTPGGGYTDPAKLLNATFAKLANEPDAATQEMMIDEALRQIEPYISPGQYQMMQSRVQRAMEQHLAYGLEAGTEDLNGVLLQSLQRAIGM
jgi:hypothetical protein